MQVWDSVKVKDDSDYYAGMAGSVQAVKGDIITVKLDLKDEPVDLDLNVLVRL